MKVTLKSGAGQTMIFENTTIGQFRAQMEHLQFLHSGKPMPHNFFGSLKTGEWESPNNGEHLVFWEHRQLGYDYSKPPKLWGLSPFQQERREVIDITPPERSTWIVQVRLADGELDEERGAIIAAFETGGRTEVEFVDGAADRKPIGASFQEFERVICEEWSATPAPAEDGTGHDRQMIRTASAMTLTLFLNTTPSLFAQWLADYTRGIHLRDFPTESGCYYSLRPVWPPHQIVGPTALDMDGFYHILPSESEETERAYPIPRLIRFKIVPLTSERIEVMLECKLPEVMDYFNELLEKMRQRWPEAAEQPGTPIPPQKMTPFGDPEFFKRTAKEMLTQLGILREGELAETPTLAEPAEDGAVGEAILGEFLTTIKGVRMDLATFGDFLARLRKDELTFERVGARRWQAKWYGCDTGYVVALPVGDELNLDFYLMKWDQDPKPVAYEEDNGEITIEWEPNVWARIIVDRVRAGLQELGVLQGDAPTPARSYTPRVPERPADYRRWRITWFKIKGEVEKGKSVAAIGDWLGKMHPHLACSTDTLSDIIRAGDAGLLDKLKLPKNP